MRPLATARGFTLFKLIKPPFIQEASNLSDLLYGKLLNQIDSPLLPIFNVSLFKLYINTIYSICQVFKSQDVVYSILWGVKESPREAKPFFKLIPLSFEGEGDTGGEVANYPTPFSFPVSAIKSLNLLQALGGLAE